MLGLQRVVVVSELEHCVNNMYQQAMDDEEFKIRSKYFIFVV